MKNSLWYKYSGKVFVAVVCLLMVFITGCRGGICVSPGSETKVKTAPPPWAPAHGVRAKHHYYYYPSSSVYFDAGRQVYFYLEGNQWKMAVSLPSYIRIDANRYVEMELDTDKPYMYHNEHRKKYPSGQLKKMHKKN